MQIIVLLGIFRELPANLSYTLDVLNEAIYLKIPFLFCKWLLGKLFAEEFMVDQMKAEIMTVWGLEDSNYFLSLGILFVAFLLILFLTLLWALIKTLNRVRTCGSSAGKIVDWLEKKLFFGILCRYMIESYLKIVFATLIFLKAEVEITT